MERRRSPRFARDEHVQLKLLSDPGGTWDVRTVDVSSTGMRIETVTSIAPGSLIQIEGQDTLLLGEVLYTTPVGACHHLGVELTSALYGLADLRRLNKSLIQASTERPARQPASMYA